MGRQTIPKNTNKIKDPFERMVVLVLGHESLATHKKISEIYFSNQIDRNAFINTHS